MNMESLPKKDTEPKNKEEILALLEEQKKIAEEQNPACASGGCGGMCGTVLCPKKVQGKINALKKSM